MWERKLMLGALTALAVAGTGCAALLEQLNRSNEGPSISEDPTLTKARQLGIAEQAEATQDALALAEVGDHYRDLVPRADYAAAHAAYRAALRLEPRNTYVLVSQATAYLRQGSDEKFSNPDGSATGDVNRLRQAEKYFKRAKTLAERALQVSPQYGTAHFVVAEVYALMGEPAKSLEKLDYIESSGLIPEGHTSTFFAWRGFVRKLQGDAAGSRADLEQAIEYSEPIEFGEYADRILNPVVGNARKGSISVENPPVVRAL